MKTWQKAGVVLVVLALAGGAGKRSEGAQSDPNQVYGPAEFGEDVGDGLDRISGGVGDAAGSSLGRSRVMQGAALGAGAYGASKAWKKWGGRSKDDPVPTPADAEEPTLPPVAAWTTGVAQ